ncbi:thioredoxin domain-containing protein [Corallococcus sp. ZKHCc1 1396]|uniref:Thioredoxin domain-containing protein n=1 Tax=Corallococcus soli TaxID=2710757 RepID=A0ABR9PZL6_9BACT|nr:thioredoxin domain-containing protein [Corallococcus soli]MBE4753385.1 thioredoxin domain-containing protein [Corallococcus soli]
MSRLRRAVGADDHVQGPRDAPVILVEYGDYQCPYCGQAYGEVKRLQQTLGDRLGLVFRNFPLTQAHPLALQAAEAAEAAGAQGRFWEMHDLLFENQDALERPVLLSHAEGLALDVDRFREDLESHRFEERVRRDFMDGVRSGVNGTPTFFANGHRHDGSFRAGDLLEALTGGLGASR